MDQDVTQPGTPEIISAGAHRASDDAELAPGTLVGRYVVLSRLGAGGMGVVYAAYDPELDRKVALKLLRRAIAESGGRARLVREARALARLQHPNVVAIYDVGTYQQRVWLAMEFLEGLTLAAWRRERARPWPAVLETLLAAGHGVAAAHESGLLHRDLKPDNVMVGDDGRVRVMDFGLARSVDGAPESPRDDVEVVRTLEVSVTRSGAQVGTPAYMAPEQFRCEESTAATDQFGFCVTLWETLFGARPFSGTGASLAAAVLGGQIERPDPGARVPGWLRRVVARGLSVDPAERWPSMPALLDALERGRTRARRRRVLAALAIAGLLLVAAATWRHIDRDRRVAACAADGAAIDEVWNPKARDILRAAVAGTGLSYAPEIADKVLPWLDAQAVAWSEVRTHACLETEVRGSWDARLARRSLWCLEERRMELDALVRALSRGEPRAATRAVQATASLVPPARCQNRHILSRLPEPPDAERDEVADIRAALADVAALEQTGAYPGGLEAARAALGRAEALGWPPLVARARLWLGRLLDRNGEYQPAAEALESAYFEAAFAGAPEVVVAAATKLVDTAGNHLEKHDRAQHWARLAEVALSSLVDRDDLREAIRLNNLAIVLENSGKYQEAERHYRRALAIRERALGPEHPQVAKVLNNLAGVYRATGDHDRARALHERALAIKEATLGAEHPAVIYSLNNLANVYLDTGTYERAAKLYRRALAIAEKAFGDEHPKVATLLSNLAGVLWATGERREGRELLERVLAIQEKALGPEHPDVARTLDNLAGFYRADDTAKAEALLERALAIRTARLGAGHPAVASSLEGLAGIRLDAGAIGEAKKLYGRALEIREAALGAEHPSLAGALIGLAEVAIARRAGRDAVTRAERALELREQEARRDQIAEARFVLARALILAGEQRARAIALARQARAAYLSAEEPRTDEIALIDEWLATHEAR